MNTIRKKCLVLNFDSQLNIKEHIFEDFQSTIFALNSDKKKIKGFPSHLEFDEIIIVGLPEDISLNNYINLHCKTLKKVVFINPQNRYQKIYSSAHIEKQFVKISNEMTLGLYVNANDVDAFLINKTDLKNLQLIERKKLFFQYLSKNKITDNQFKKDDLSFLNNKHTFCISRKNSGFSYVRGISNYFITLERNVNSLTIGNNGNTNIIFGGKGYSYLKLYNSSNNIGFGCAGNDSLNISKNSSYNIMHGNSGDDSLSVSESSSFNSLFGGKGNDQLNALSQSSHNNLYAGSGNDQLFAYNDTFLNRFFGNSGQDIMGSYHNTKQNKFYGEEGHDTIISHNNSHENLFYAGPGNDTVFDITYNLNGQNTFYGEEGHDSMIGYTLDTNFHGGANNDVLFLYQSLLHHPDNDADTKFKYQKTHSLLLGEEGNDIIITSGLNYIFIKGQTLKYFPYSEIEINGGAGNDIIFPFIAIPQLTLKAQMEFFKDQEKNLHFHHDSFNERKIKKNNISESIDKIKINTPFKNKKFLIEGGTGKDLIFIPKIYGSNTEVHIKDFNPQDDSFIFDSKNEAENFYKSIVLSFNKQEITFKHNSTSYFLNIKNKPSIFVSSLEDDENAFGKCKKPVWSYEEKTLSSYIYKFDNIRSKILKAQKLSELSQHIIQKEKLHKYTSYIHPKINITYNKSILPTLKENIIIHSTKSKNFFCKDLFYSGEEFLQDENAKFNVICVNEDFEPIVKYYDLPPLEIYAVIVHQTNSKNFSFSYGQNNTIKDKETRLLTTSEFFDFGAFHKKESKVPASTTLEVGFLFKDKKKIGLISTPLTKIQISVQ